MKTQHRRSILAVDDDDINLMILAKNVQEAGYTVKSFSSGDAAWEFLLSNPGDIDIALVDKMMPGVNGLELLRRMKNNESLRHIPVILQTGDAGVAQMREGLDNGAYYYLTKPFHPEILTAILRAVDSECAVREDLLSRMASGQSKFISLLSEGEFVLKTHEEARSLSAAISQAANYPEFVAMGLMEVLSNAIEHGNLEMGYNRKRQAMLSNSWTKELSVRANSAEYGRRVVRVHVEKTPTGLHLTVRDEGKGFDWERFMYDDRGPGRLSEPNGRGIAKAMIMLDDMRYGGNGSEVHCNIGLPGLTLVLEDAQPQAVMRN